MTPSKSDLEKEAIIKTIIFRQCDLYSCETVLKYAQEYNQSLTPSYYKEIVDHYTALDPSLNEEPNFDDLLGGEYPSDKGAFNK